MPLQEVQTLKGHVDRVWAIAWSPQGNKIASCSGDKTVRIWMQEGPGGSWVCVSVLEPDAQQRTIRAIDWTPDGKYLATGCFDATTAVWELQGGEWEMVALLEGHENEVKSVAWSPSGSLLATCSRDKSVWIWEANPGNEFECVDVKQGHAQDVKMCRWHPSGEVLVSASYDDTIKLWQDDGSGDEWTCVQTLEGQGVGHTSTVWGLSFEDGGRRMVSCSDDLTLKIWDCMFSERAMPLWTCGATLSGYHERTIFSVDWGRNGLIASSGADDAIRIFREDVEARGGVHVDTGHSFSLAHEQSKAHTADINCVQWSPTDAGLLASCGDDNVIRIWRWVDPDAP